MKLLIDNMQIDVEPDLSLYDMLERRGVFTGRLSEDPIVAKISGRVFTLNYIPLRTKDLSPERGSIRKAMAASDGTVQLIRYSDPVGRDAYTRTAQFVIFLAISARSSPYVASAFSFAVAGSVRKRR